MPRELLISKLMKRSGRHVPWWADSARSFAIIPSSNHIITFAFILLHPPVPGSRLDLQCSLQMLRPWYFVYEYTSLLCLPMLYQSSFTILNLSL